MAAFFVGNAVLINVLRAPEFQRTAATAGGLVTSHDPERSFASQFARKT